MSYIVRVVGYSAYWTGDTKPGKCWSESINDAKLFDSKDDAEEIVATGWNMEAVEYDYALANPQTPPPNWDAIDLAAKKLKRKNAGRGFKVAPPEDRPHAIVEELEQEDFEENFIPLK